MDWRHIRELIAAGQDVYGAMLNLIAWVKSNAGQGSFYRSQHELIDVAREERVTAAYVYVLLRLRWLAPDVTTAIVNGQQPPQLNAKRLMRLTAHLPGDWAEQRALLGFY